jgi:hypothetical protein
LLARLRHNSPGMAAHCAWQGEQNQVIALEKNPRYFLQRYVVDNMLVTSVTTLPFLQAARTYVKGYEQLHGFKIRFETTWLDKP